MKRVLWVSLLAALLLPATAVTATIVDFEDVPLTVPPAANYAGPGGGQYYNGSDGAGSFTSGGASFTNNYNTTFLSWDGWSVSNTSDTTTADFTNQYSAITGGANSGSQYGMYYEPFALAPSVDFGAPVTVQNASVTNATYPYLSMLNGDAFAKQFGGPTGNDPDWFLLTISGVDSSGGLLGSVDFYLADYRFADNAQDYIVAEWTTVDLTSLGVVYGLQFDLSSSDVGEFGMNTPGYVAFDDLSHSSVPVPAAVWLLGTGLVGLVCVRRRTKT